MRLVDWLAQPRADRGLHLRTLAGGWDFRSYCELADDVHRVSARLRALGAQRGDVISLVLADPWTFIAAFWGTVAAGMVPSPLATPLAFRAADRYVSHLGAIFAVARPSVILTDHVLADLVLAAPAQPGPAPSVVRLDLSESDDAAAKSATPLAPQELSLLQFTSGSTGTPKGVRITRAALESNVTSIREWLQWRDDDVFASWLPLYHDMGLIGGMVVPVVSGTDLWLMTPDQFIRSPLGWLECFGRHGATMTTSPSFGYAYTARRVAPQAVAELNFSGWRVAILGAERIEPAAIAAFYQLVAPRGFDDGALIGAYGLAEVTLAASGTKPGSGSRFVRTETTALSVGEAVIVTESGRLGPDDACGAGLITGCGSALAGSNVSIVDDDGVELPDAAFGEIRLSGSSLADGYLTSGGARLDFDEDGLLSGDSGFVLHGELYVVGRIGESMKVRGASIHAEDVEMELAELTDLAKVRCAVAFGYLDDSHVAAVFVEGEVDPGWVGAAVERIRVLTAGTARPVVLRGERGAILRTSSGKPRRRTMWADLVAGAAQEWTLEYGAVSAKTGR